MTLTVGQIATLRELDEIWPQREAVIIGATALGFYYDMRWRQTADVDLALALDLAEFPGPLATRAGWTPHPRHEHEFVSPHGVKVDVIPAGASMLAVGEIRWRSGRILHPAGVDLAFRHAEHHEVADGYRVRVAPPAVIVVLKMAAYGDRPAERERDLEDIAHLLDEYIGDDSERRWTEGGAVGEFDLVPAYVLGKDVAAIVAAGSHREIVDNFLDLVADPDLPAHATMTRRGPSHWRRQDSAVLRRLSAFRSGMASAAV